MMIMLYFIACCSYLGIFIWMLYCLYNKQPVVKKIGLGGLFLGLICHVCVLYPHIITREGMNFNVFNIVSLTSLFLLSFFLLFSLIRPITSLGILASPTAFIGLTAGFFGRVSYQPISDLSVGLQMHIMVSIAGYSLLLMSAVQAVIVRLQIRELKHQTLQPSQRLWVSTLPPLQSMERLLFDMIILGFALLTTALLSGLLYVDDFFAQHLTHKAVFSLLSWVIFANLLFGHWRYGWRGRRAANFTLYGFALLAVGFVGSKVVLELVL